MASASSSLPGLMTMGASSEGPPRGPRKEGAPHAEASTYTAEEEARRRERAAEKKERKRKRARIMKVIDSPRNPTAAALLFYR